MNRLALLCAAALLCGCAYKNTRQGDYVQATEDTYGKDPVVGADLVALLESSEHNDLTSSAYECLYTFAQVREAETKTAAELVARYDEANRPGKNPREVAGSARLQRKCERSCGKVIEGPNALPRDLALAQRYGPLCQSEYAAFYSHFGVAVAEAIREKAFEANATAAPDWLARFVKELQAMAESVAKHGTPEGAARIDAILAETRGATAQQLARYRAYKADPRVPGLERRLERIDAQLQLVGRSDPQLLRNADDRAAATLRRQLYEDQRAIASELSRIQAEKQ